MMLISKRSREYKFIMCNEIGAAAVFKIYTVIVITHCKCTRQSSAPKSCDHKKFRRKHFLQCRYRYSMYLEPRALVRA